MMEEVIQFLRKSIIGKTLFTDEVVYKLADGKLEGVYSDKVIFFGFS